MTIRRVSVCREELLYVFFIKVNLTVKNSFLQTQNREFLFPVKKMIEIIQLFFYRKHFLYLIY